MEPETETIEDAPVAEGETPEPEPFVLPEDFASQVQGWEVELDDLPKAVETYKRLQTEEGIIDGFISMGQSLGFGLKELNRLFDEEAPAPAPPAAPAPVGEPLDPERLMTAAEVEDMLKGVREEQQQFQAQQQQASVQQRQKQVFDAMDTWFSSQDVGDDNARRQIAAFGEKHVLPGQDSYDPRVAIAALERGKAEYDSWVEAEAQAYLKKKQAVASGQPTPVGGAPTHGGGSEEAPAKYEELGQKALATAKERVRARLRANGELA